MAEEAKGGSDDKDLLKRGRADFETALEYWSDNRKKWLEDAKFCIPGNQWDAKLKKEREDKGLACLEVDKLNQYRRQVVNDGRQNRPGIKVRPVDDTGDDEAAEAFQGVVRDICDQSNVDESVDTALDHAAKGGFGYFRVLSQYVHEKTFLQELVVRRVRNPLSVVTSPHLLADGSDIDFGFVIEDVPKTTFKEKWPKAKMTDWKNDAFSGDWSAENTVKVCEYYYKVRTLQLVHLLEDGTFAADEDYQRAVTQGGKTSPIVKSREIPTHKVKWCRMTGAEILEQNDWLGKYIPIIPVYGNEDDIEGKVIVSGLVRGAKDAQKLHNYARTKFAERVAMTPLAPWTVAEESIEGHPEWQTANSGTHGALVFRAYTDDGQPLPRPERVSPSDIPAGFSQDAAMSEHDIQASMGMYNASIGEKSNEKSGRAIMARQREGDTATFHYQDNVNRALRYLGRILVDAVPKYYDTKRVVRSLGEDGMPKMIQLDPNAPKASQKQGATAIYNLNVGRYDVSVSAGPTYTTKRQESADAMIELTRANPTMWQTHGDLIVKAQDWPNADEFAKRSKMALPPPIAQAVQAEEQAEGGQDPEVAAVIAQANQAMGELQKQIQAAEAGIDERDKALADAEAKLQTFENEKAAQAGMAKIEQAAASVAESVTKAQADERVRLEKQRADEAEFELLRAQAKRELEELQEQTVEAVKALLVPAPAVEQPEAAPPPGPSPELMAILEHLGQQSQAITQGFAALSRPRTATLSDGRQVRID